MPRGGGRDIPSVIAVPRKTDSPILFGKAAASADPDDFHHLYNWKLLLGKTLAEIEGEATHNRALARAMEITTLQELIAGFLQSTLALTATGPSEIEVDALQLIVGIPPLTATESSRWRETYKRRIEQALVQFGLRKPRFWPEPFAIFQYLKNLGSVPDTGTHQNVLIVDVGGGTTNVCLIQTTKHGRLARGGTNHIPHGVRSVPIGGSTLDLKLAEALVSMDGPATIQSVLPLINAAKERIALRLNVTGQSRPLFTVSGRWFSLPGFPVNRELGK